MQRCVYITTLLALLGIGGVLRLRHLDYPTMGSDVMIYYTIAQNGIHPGELLVNSPKYLGDLPPLWFAAHNWFLQTLRLDVTFRNVRLLDAFCGILTILAAFGAASAAGGRRVGLLAALFVAIQPLHVQMSRECYFYAPIVLGCFLAIWAFMNLASRGEGDGPPRPMFYLLAFSSFLLLTNVQISSWSFAAIFAGALFALLLPPALRGKSTWRPLIWITLGFLLIGIPTLLSDWGMRDAISAMFGRSKEYWSNVFGDRLGNPWLDSGRILFAYLIGSSGLRLWASLCCLLAGIGALACQRKFDRKMRLFGVFTAGTIILLVALHMKSFYPMENRHYANLFPLLTILTCSGLVHWGDRSMSWFRRPRARNGTLALASVFILGFNADPAWLSTRLDWDPPFAKVSQWADTHLPDGTVVQCDRWYTPWNEFRINPASNVVFTFTVPNEPIQTYISSRWRETAKDSFAINPRAALFEQKTYWSRLGPWTWPQTYFAHKQVFFDEVAARLDAMGLFYRSRQLAYPREWIPVTLYYNTEDDLVARARAARDRVLCLFGSGWQYTKTQDYRDWYALQDAATVHLHNLTPAPLAVHLDVIGAGYQAAITVTAFAGPNVVFPPNQIQTNRFGPIELVPGRNEIRLRNLAKSQPPPPLLVQRISATEN